MSNPLWCEDCRFFGHADMGGEGWCDVYDKSTWYGKNAIDCPYFVALKQEGKAEGERK